ATAVGRARRAAEAASERFDLVLVKLGLISEADLCLAYATYCGLPLIEPVDLPARPVLADRLQFSFLKTNRILPISFDGLGPSIVARPTCTSNPAAMLSPFDIV